MFLTAANHQSVAWVDRLRHLDTISQAPSPPPQFPNTDCQIAKVLLDLETANLFSQIQTQQMWHNSCALAASRICIIWALRESENEHENRSWAFREMKYKLWQSPPVTVQS